MVCAGSALSLLRFGFEGQDCCIQQSPQQTRHNVRDEDADVAMLTTKKTKICESCAHMARQMIEPDPLLCLLSVCSHQPNLWLYIGVVTCIRRGIETRSLLHLASALHLDSGSSFFGRRWTQRWTQAGHQPGPALAAAALLAASTGRQRLRAARQLLSLLYSVTPNSGRSHLPNAPCCG